MEHGKGLFREDEVPLGTTAALKEMYITDMYSSGVQELTVPSPWQIEAFTTAALFNDTKTLREKITEHGKYILNELDKQQHTALYYTCNSGRREQFDYLIACGADVNLDGSAQRLTPLMKCAMDGDEYKIKVLLDRGADVLRRDQQGKNAVDYAEKNSHTKLAAFLRLRMDEAVTQEVGSLYSGIEKALPVQRVQLKPRK